MRTLSAGSYTPGVPITVTVQVDPDPDAIAWVVEDTPPIGWTVSDINESGAYDAVNGKVKWGLFFDADSRALTYTVTPPADASTVVGFTGLASFDGTNVTTTGDASLDPPPDCLIDDDADGIGNCADDCPNTPPGDPVDANGCSTADDDGDGTPNDNDACPDDIDKTAPGQCGCGVADTDTDADGIPDCNDTCPDTLACADVGADGCPIDSDNDGTPNGCDGCPNDVNKTSPGNCGCGQEETPDCDACPDDDNDGTCNDADGCPNDPNKTSPGTCGCGVADTAGCGSTGGGAGGGAPNPALPTEPESPAAPTSLSAIATPDAVTISWSDQAENEDGYELQRRTDADWSLLAELPADTESYIDDTILPGTTYRYRVRSFAGDQVSEWIELGPIVTPAALLPPSAPEDLTLTTVTFDLIALTWTDTATSETGYAIERRIGSGNWLRMTELPAGATGYDDATVEPATLYAYRVAAFNAAGSSDWLTTSAVQTPDGPDPVSQPVPPPARSGCGVGLVPAAAISAIGLFVLGPVIRRRAR